MHTFFFLAMAIVQAVILLLAVRQFEQNRSMCTSAIVLLVLVGLFYDNLVIGLGRFIGEGPLLQTLNAGRFFIHAIFTPMLIMYAIAAAHRLDVKWTAHKITYSAFGFLTLGLIGLGVYDDIIELVLVPEIENGIVRYVNATSAGPPIPAIVTILVLIVIGAFIWRRQRWPILCVGSILMFVAAGAGASILLLANFGEIVLSASVVWTDYKLRQSS